MPPCASACIPALHFVRIGESDVAFYRGRRKSSDAVTRNIDENKVVEMRVSTYTWETQIGVYTRRCFVLTTTVMIAQHQQEPHFNHSVWFDGRVWAQGCSTLVIGLVPLASDEELQLSFDCGA